MKTKTNSEEKYRKEWREHTRNAFTFVISLFLTFSVAALGFGLNLLQSRELPYPFNDFQKFCLVLGLLLLTVSVVCGIGAVFSRLWRFSLTAYIKSGIVNCRYLWFIKEPSRVSKIDILGKRTRCLFLIEVVTFILGICFMISVILSVYGNRLIFL